MKLIKLPRRAGARSGRALRVTSLLAASALALAMTPALSASAATTGTYDIALDGFCDGIQLSFPSTGTGTVGTVDGVQTGCASNAIYGQAQGKNFHKGTTYITDAPDNLMYIVNKDHTFHIYGLSGTTLQLLLTGTWTDGPPPRDRGVPSAMAAHNATGSADGSISKKIKEIALDGYCDGMHFNIPSAGTGAKNTIDGMRTGCASDGLMGEVGHIRGQPAGNIVSFFADSSLWIQAGVFKDHTWVFYATDGTQIFLLNAGTWTTGPPPRTAGLKPSI